VPEKPVKKLRQEETRSVQISLLEQTLEKPANNHLMLKELIENTFLQPDLRRVIS
jgi:hypothetical protein